MDIILLLYNKNYSNYTRQFCIIGLTTLKNRLESIKQLYTDLTFDFILLDNCKISVLWRYLESNGLERFKCYTIPDATETQLVNYFERLYKSTDKCKCNIVNQLQYNNRYTVINTNTNPEESYLEIGVEYGTTFQNVHFTNKTGVDPDPKCEGIIKSTSDDFFKTNQMTFDNIFIDGMHQTEYILNDFNNSINCLNTNGIIFIDDILPINFNEQLKIPEKHVYENGILKYIDPWTGDVWKFVYYLLVLETF
jgi:hypothetical protein